MVVISLPVLPKVALAVIAIAVIIVAMVFLRGRR